MYTFSDKKNSVYSNLTQYSILFQSVLTQIICSGFIKIEDCLCYLEHKTTLINAGKGATFEEAVSACETYIKHPMVGF